MLVLTLPPCHLNRSFTPIGLLVFLLLGATLLVKLNPPAHSQCNDPGITINLTGPYHYDPDSSLSVIGSSLTVLEIHRDQIPRIRRREWMQGRMLNRR